MTIRSPVSAPKPIWSDSQQVDETDLTTQQTADATVESSTINNHIGTGILPENLVQPIIFDSSLTTVFLDGLPIQAQAQPTDTSLGNQLAITLTQSDVSVYRTVKICLIGLDFQSNLQYETFVFKTNETQVTVQHFTKVLLLLFNDFRGNPTVSFNLGGQVVISQSMPMQLSRDPIMIAQDVQPNLFFRDFFLDPSLGPISLQTMLQGALPFYNVTDLNIMTQGLETLVLLSGDVTTQIGQKFQAVTNNIQKISLLLSVRNLVVGQQNNLVWTGDLIVSIYPLQSTLNCPTDLAPGLPINFSPSNIPVAQISFNYATLQAAGVVLNSVPQPVDFIFSNTPAAIGNLIIPGSYYCVAAKRAGNNNQCDILITVGGDDLANSNAATFTGDIWVDLPDEDLWFRVWTDASKVSDGQAYDTGSGVTIPKTTTDPSSQATVDYSFGPQQFVGTDTFRAVLTAVDVDSVPIPDARTGNPVFSRQQLEPQVTLMGTIAITNLENSTEPLILGTISDKNLKTFNTNNVINSVLYSATLANNTMLIRIPDDPTDPRFNTAVTGLVTNLLNGNLVGAQIAPDGTNPSVFYRVANARLCSMILGDVDGNGIIDINDLNLLNTYLGYNLNVGLPPQTIVVTTGQFVGATTTYVNGYETVIQPFANLFSVQFQLVDPNTNLVVADGYDGVLIANPADPRLAQFTSASVAFNTIIGLSSYKLVVLTNTNQADYGGFDIVSLDSIADVLTIQKVFLNENTLGQMLRADIDGDYVITSADGYLLENYLERELSSLALPTTYPAPSTNPYTKIGTRFNVIELELEQYVDRTDDYAANPATRSTSVHPLPDIFLNDGYFYSHDFFHFPVPVTFTEQLTWDESLIVTSSQAKLVPSVFTSNVGFNVSSCLINGIQCNVYPVVAEFDPGTIDYFVPNNLIIGTGELHRPDGDFYKVDFEVGTIVLEIPDGLFGTERTIDIVNDFIVDTTGNGATRLGFPSMRFADCSFVGPDALADDQVRFSVAVQSFSPNLNGLSSDGYYGAIVDGKMGVSVDYATGLLTLNFSNLYQDPTMQTLSTKIQINVFLKKGGFNNQPLFVDSTQVANILSLISVFSGANDGGPSALVDLGSDVSGILPIINGGTGLNAVGAAGTVLTSNGSGLSYQFFIVSAQNVAYTPAVPADWPTIPTTVQQALDELAAESAMVITLTGDATGSGSGTIATTVGRLQGSITLSGAPNATYDVLVSTSPSAAAWRQLTQDDIAPGFIITSFVGGSTVEIGLAVVNPAFTASYDQVPTSANITNTFSIDSPLTLVSPYTSGTVVGSFNSATQTSCTFTLTATGTSTKMATQAITWDPRSFGGVGGAGATSATASGTSAVLNSSLGTLTDQGLFTSPIGSTFGSFSPSSQKIYLMFPHTASAHTFKDQNGFTFAMNAPTNFTFTNANSQTVSMDLYESTNILNTSFSITVVT